MTKSLSLEQQCVTALTGNGTDQSPAELLTLIADTEAGIAKADAAAERARQDFLDPIQTPDINAGRARVEAVEFTGDRLRSLLPRLQDRYRELANAEARADWRSKDETLERERDQIAEEIKQIYPTAASRDRRCAELRCPTG